MYPILLSQVHPDWRGVLVSFIEEDIKLKAFLNRVASGEEEIYPGKYSVFNAFTLSPRAIKVVLIGQDPYPTKGYATGFAFAIPEITANSPYSLQRIFKEVHNSYGANPDRNQTLSSWIIQGVFLLNSALTIEPGIPDSHTALWSNFTRKVLEFLSNKIHPVFLVLGKNAKNLFSGFPNELIFENFTQALEYKPDIQYKPCIAYAPHPAGDRYIGENSPRKMFLGSEVFITVNQLLLKKKQLQIKF